MAGSKRNKIKKALSPKSVYSPPPDNTNDEELLDDLVAQLDSRDGTVQHEAATVIQEVEQKANEQADSKKDSRSRFEARQARKAAERAAQYTTDDPANDARLEAEAKAEEAAIQKVCDELNLVMHEVNPDGHCLFAAIADQLRILGILSNSQATYATTREAASRYIFSHPNDFLPFLPSDEGEDGEGATDPGFMTPAQFERYCASIRDTGIWGGEPEILALSRAYNVPIHVVQHGVPPIVIHDPHEGTATKNLDGKTVVRISYHRRMYGLGEHYNSLRPKTFSSQLSALLP